MTEELDKMSTDELGRLFPVYLMDYNSDWKDLFLTEKQIIFEAVGINHINRIEHIGSTAIPGLCAKPTIDILVEINDNTNTESVIYALKQLHYHYIPRPDNPPPHMMFVKGYSTDGYSGQAYHIHVRYRGDWDEIVFRDYLIKHAETAKKYSELKHELSLRYKNDREKYTDSKTDFIIGITMAAREELSKKANFKFI